MIFYDKNQEKFYFDGHSIVDDAAAQREARGIPGEAPQNLEHRLHGVVLGRIGVGRAGLDVLELPVPVPVGERMRLQPGEAAVGRLRPAGIPCSLRQGGEEDERTGRHERVPADGLAGREA